MAERGKKKEEREQKRQQEIQEMAERIFYSQSPAAKEFTRIYRLPESVRKFFLAFMIIFFVIMIFGAVRNSPPPPPPPPSPTLEEARAQGILNSQTLDWHKKEIEEEIRHMLPPTARLVVDTGISGIKPQVSVLIFTEPETDLGNDAVDRVLTIIQDNISGISLDDILVMWGWQSPEIMYDVKGVHKGANIK